MTVLFSTPDVIEISNKTLKTEGFIIPLGPMNNLRRGRSEGVASWER